MAPTGRLRLLGDLRVEFDGEAQHLWPSAQRLIALLAVHHRDRHARRVTVAERLCPDVATSRATSSLRSILWRMPRPRGRLLVVGNASDVWLGPDLGVDLWDAEELTRRIGSADLSDRAPETDLGLLRHDLLPGWDDPWLAADRESYRQKRLHALERTSLMFCQQGRFTDALDAGLRAVQSEPLRESAHRRVIEAHLAEGNQAEALRQYELYRRLLADELGLRPSERIRRLVAPLLGRPLDLHPSE